MPIDRTGFNAWIDDDGSGTVGTVLDKATMAADILDPIDAALIRTGAIGLVIDGAGSVIATGIKGFLRVPFACTIVGWSILSTDAAATVGSIVVDVWKDTLGNYPPTAGDSITASAKPTIASANKAESTTLTGWNTAIAAGDVLGFNVDSVASLTRVSILLTVRAT